MGFKIKKSILAGTSGHRKAVTDRNASLIKINRSMDRSSRDDGRAKSSALQLTTEEKRKLLSDVTTKNKPTVDVTTVDNDKGGVDTTTTTTNTGENIKTYEKEQVSDFRKNCYVNGVFQKGKTINGQLCEHAKKGEEPKETDEVITPINESNVDKSSTEKKGCECASKQSYMGVKVGQMMKHECGKTHPACSEKPGDTPDGSKCECTDPQKKKHTYECPGKGCGCPKPKVCEGAKTKCDLTSDEMKAKRQACKEKGTALSRVRKRWYFSTRTCQCESKGGSGKDFLDDAKEVIGKCIPKIGKNGKSIGCDANESLSKFHSTMNPK